MNRTKHDIKRTADKIFITLQDFCDFVFPPWVIIHFYSQPDLHLWVTLLTNLYLLPMCHKRFGRYDVIRLVRHYMIGKSDFINPHSQRLLAYLCLGHSAINGTCSMKVIVN